MLKDEFSFLDVFFSFWIFNMFNISFFSYKYIYLFFYSITGDKIYSKCIATWS